MPVALLQNETDHQLIDASGAIIEGADPRDFTHLKVVAGDNAAAHAAPILAALKTEPELFSEVWAISFRSERRWDVHLKNGMEIRLPKQIRFRRGHDWQLLTVKKPSPIAIYL